MVKNRIIVNNISVEVEEGSHVVVRNGVLYVNGETVQSQLSGEVHIVWHGDLAYLETDGAVTCRDVGGNVTAGGPVTCRDVDGSITAGSSVAARGHSGDVGAHARGHSGDVVAEASTAYARGGDATASAHAHARGGSASSSRSASAGIRIGHGAINTGRVEPGVRIGHGGINASSSIFFD